MDLPGGIRCLNESSPSSFAIVLDTLQRGEPSRVSDLLAALDRNTSVRTVSINFRNFEPREGNVGRTMDQVDRQKAHRTLEGNPTGQSTTWRNPDSGNEYEVTPTRTYEESGRPCRDYTTEAWIDGRRETVRGTACREPDGTWRAI